MARLKFSLLVLCAVAAGCAKPSPSGALPTTDLRIGAQTYTLEIANTKVSRERGLMERDAMPDGHGMIFVFDRERPLNFWMKNTRIPLDILYLDNSGQIVSIHTMKPYDTRTETTSARPAKYAIELNAGQANRAGVKPGDVLDIPASAREPSD